MIKELEDNDMVACINLMDQSWVYNEGYGVGYTNKNEYSWINHLMEHIINAKDNPHYVAIGYWRDDQLLAFLLASTFKNFYSTEWTMDVKDCIVDHSKNTVFAVTAMMDWLMKHIDDNGGKYWRADTVRDYDNSLKYATFLANRYDGYISHTVRGKIGG